MFLVCFLQIRQSYFIAIGVDTVENGLSKALGIDRPFTKSGLSVASELPTNGGLKKDPGQHGG
jgi:hypothetical protein